MRRAKNGHGWLLIAPPWFQALRKLESFLFASGTRNRDVRTDEAILHDIYPTDPVYFTDLIKSRE